ncbi:alpha-1,6-mannosyltransferase [Ascoidea rubescens DSM 1968]|uniref:Glycosyltransferase family 34 protein n=1 Tax=Ascoidea rubescens DSM 1968 TaxID=1344418 RepID=A0A1D2VN36_9ASCO|nr:glycosyltransferase family 34 protein [Ascoidea rubescens DSM 1968]ODV63020.1 glycosyltransferase family 34 protein [Ascoidea rubescens DSM 1968]
MAFPQQKMKPKSKSFNRPFSKIVNKKFIYTVISVFLFYLFFLRSNNDNSDSSNYNYSFSPNNPYQHLPKEHGIYNDQILTSDPLIYPSVQYAPFLRELTLSKLFQSKTDENGNLHYVYDQDLDESERLFSDDDTANGNNDNDNNDNDLNDLNYDENLNGLALNKKSKSDKNNNHDDYHDDLNIDQPYDDNEDDEIHFKKAKKSFKNHGKIVFDARNNKSPDLVIVTSLDFEKFELTHLTKVITNRIDYCKANNFGFYSRWVQEFIPILQKHNSNKSWVKLMIMREAFHAFPNSKYFWYLDQDSIIMRYDLNLINYLLAPSILNPIILKDQPIIPPSGAIHTYKNIKPQDIRFLITQNENSIDSTSFILINDIYGKAILEFWQDDLFRKYTNFQIIENALTHILQWHPVLLSKTALLPPRTIASLHSVMDLPKGGDHLHYYPGDLVVNLKDCEARKSCESEFESYYQQIDKN